MTVVLVIVIIQKIDLHCKNAIIKEDCFAHCCLLESLTITDL